MSHPDNTLQHIFTDLELLEVRFVVRTANAYDALLVWQQREAIIEALEVGSMVALKQPCLDVFIGDELIDSTERLERKLTKPL